MLQQESPQIGDRISARHSSNNANCHNTICPEIDGFVRSVGKTAILVDDGEVIKQIHIHNGWDITVHPEIHREDI